MPAAITNRDEIAQTIVRRIAGGEFLKDICAEEGMPCPQTFWEWTVADAGLAMQCAQARARAAEHNEREVARLATAAVKGDVGHEAARVAINAHTWLAKVRNPKVYGDKLDIDAKVAVRKTPVLNLLLVGAPPGGPDVIDLQPEGGDGDGEKVEGQGG